MPCPYFEPQYALPQATLPNARLPLIEEFEGVCRALAEAAPVPAETRLRLCNHGNARGLCCHFPEQEQRSAFRFEVLRRSAAHLDVLFIEEALLCSTRVAPLEVHNHPGNYWNPNHRTLAKRAQLLAFCRSYLRRYPA